MNEEEAILADDQLQVVGNWLAYMQSCSDKETLSFDEIIEIQSVYDLVKHGIY